MKDQHGTQLFALSDSRRSTHSKLNVDAKNVIDLNLVLVFFFSISVKISYNSQCSNSKKEEITVKLKGHKKH